MQARGSEEFHRRCDEGDAWKAKRDAEVLAELEASSNATATCRIRWIDDQGNPTPDSNPAVGYVRCLGYRIPENPSYRPEPSEWFPICAHHKDVMDNDCLPVERGGRWEFKPLEEAQA